MGCQLKTDQTGLLLTIPKTEMNWHGWISNGGFWNPIRLPTLMVHDNWRAPQEMGYGLEYTVHLASSHRQDQRWSHHRYTSDFIIYLSYKVKFRAWTRVKLVCWRILFTRIVLEAGLFAVISKARVTSLWFIPVFWIVKQPAFQNRKKTVTRTLCCHSSSTST